MNVRDVLIGFILSAVVVGIAVSCGGGGGGYGGSGSSMPPVASGTGRGAVVVDATTRGITGGLSFKGLSGSVTSVGIYQAAAGQNQTATTAIIELTVDRVNAVVPANTPALTVDQFNALQAGNLYFLIKTSTFPSGEIRGQITGTANLVAGLAPSIDAAQEGGGVMSSGTGTGAFVVDSSTRLIIAGLMTYANLNNPLPSAAHIHSSAQANAVRVNFLPPLAALATPTDPDTPITSTDLTDFSNGNLYFNVHTATYPGGEIRGAIVPTTTQVVRSATLDTMQVVP